MCRLLVVKQSNVFAITDQLKPFAELSKNSKEFQGHGWGLAYLDDKNEWQYYKNIKPIWEDDLEQFGSTRFLVVHARSAFEDKDIVVENNMPFYDDNFIFIFNGELRGVKIKSQGRIGAEKIFNYIKRFVNEDRGIAEALYKAVEIIKKKTTYVKSMNIMIMDKETQEVHVSTDFSEQPDYFTLYYKEQDNGFMVCSDPYPGETDWEKIENHSVRSFT